MKHERLKQPEPVNTGITSMAVQPVVGRLAKSEQPGVIMVEYNGSEPIPARILSGIKRQSLTSNDHIGRDVLIVFEGGNPELPIIIGMLESLLEDLVAQHVEPEELREETPLEARVDGKRVVLEADEEIELKCGKGSIKLKKDGKIVVKGTNLISRASGTNKIKGGAVELN